MSEVPSHLEEDSTQPSPVALAPQTAPEVAERPIDAEAAEAYGRLQYAIAQSAQRGNDSIFTVQEFEQIRGASYSADPVEGYCACLLSVVMNMNTKPVEAKDGENVASLDQLIASVNASSEVMKKLAGQSRERFLLVASRANPQLAPNGVDALAQDPVGSQRAVQWVQQQFRGAMSKLEGLKPKPKAPTESAAG